MMRVYVLYFQMVRDLAGTGTEELEIPEGSTVQDAVNLLTERHSRLRAAEKSLLCAVNEEWVPRSSSLEDGATLALMPPVSGG